MPQKKDDNLVVKRPEWFKWFGSRYLTSVEHWEADQRGWYHKLLVWSAVQGEPAGYLPSDDDELRAIAGFNSNTFSRVFSALASSPDLKLLIEEYNKQQERKWQQVMRKFKPSTEYPDRIYNKVMVEVMKDAMRFQDFRSQGGQKAAEQKRQQQALLALDGSRQNASDNSREYSEENSIDSTRASSSNSSSKALNKPTLFDESKFQVTNEMRDTIRKRHPELVEEDFQELRDTFCHNRYGQSHLSWKRQFYTYVHNQITKYEYKPHKQRPLKLESGGRTNGTRYESTAERNARLEQENDEYIRLRKLRNSSGGNLDENQKALRLAPNDVNRTG